MPGRLAAVALATAAAGLAGTGCGDGQVPDIDVPEDVAARAQAADAYSKPLGAAMLGTRAAEDDGYLAAYVTHFTSLTPEVGMKWDLIHPDEDDYRFEEADQLMELARDTGKRVRGHPLVWDEQLPDWVADGDWTKAELAAVLRDHIREVAGRYRARIAEWDVVNEPFEPDGSLTRSVFFRVLGEQYIDLALRAAREADPKAKLFINEYGTEVPGPKADAMLSLVRRLRARGVPLDGVGFQQHTSAVGFPTREQLLASFRPYERMGLLTAITEMDAVVPAESNLSAQADAYAAAADACLEAPSCTGLTVWGVTDKYSWRGEDQRPLTFDSDGRPKPALPAVVDRFAR
jgi:endo-1,4-beta-xylanase